jgi:hypothetical protein
MSDGYRKCERILTLPENEDTLKKVQEKARESEAIETPTEKVKRAITDMRSIATAIQAFATDMNLFPEMSSNAPFTLDGIRLCRALDMAPQLAPDYIQFYPAWDPWGSPYLYWSAPGKNHFVVLCMGADGRVDPSNKIKEIMATIDKQGYATVPINNSCLGADIAWYDNAFIQLPQGPMKDCNERR